MTGVQTCALPISLSSPNAGSYTTAVAYTLANGTNGGLASNYSLASSTGVAAIVNAKTLTIGAPSIAGKTYDGSTAVGALTLGTLSGFVGSETVTATGSAAALSSPNAGSYTTTVAYTLANGTNGGLASNYTLASSTGVAAVINAKALTIGAPSIAAKTYDATTAAGTLTIGTLSGFVGSETVTATGSAAALSGKNVGSYTTTVAYTLANGTNGGLASNYVLASSTGVVSTVNQAMLTVTAGNASKTYDGLSYSGGNGVSYSGFVGGETASVLGGSLAYGGTSQGAVNAGSYVITPSGLTSGNYAITYANGTLTVNKAALSLLYTANAATSVYGATPASVGGSATGTGFVNGETVSNLNGSAAWTTPVTATSGIGSYAIDGSGLTSSNYTITASQAAANGTAYTVTKAALTVTANAASKTYDGLSYSGGNGVSYSGFVNSETASVLGGSLAYGGTSQGAVNAGSYVITPSGLTSGNYAITYADGTLTVNKAALTLTGSLRAADKTYNRNTDATIDTSGLHLSGVVSGETVALDWTGVTGSFASRAVARDANGNVIAQTVTASGAGVLSGAPSVIANYSYSVSAPTAMAIITPKALTIGGYFTADDKSYDGITAAGISTSHLTLAGAESGDDVSLNLAGATGSFASKDVARDSSGAIIAQSVRLSTTGSLSGNDKENYSFSASAPTTMAIIRPAVLTISGTTIADKTYDGTTAPGTVTLGNVGGWVGSERLTIGATAAALASSNVGSYATSVAYVLSGGTNGGLVSNYTLADSTGVASAITPALLTITGNTRSVTYDGMVHTNGYAITSGTLYGSDSVTSVTGLATGINAGSYSDGQLNATGTGLTNYAISYVNGGLTIDKAALTVTARNASKTYDGQAWSGGNGVTYSGFVNGETASVMGGILSYGGTAQGALHAGRYALSASGLSSGNYSITYVDGELTIDRKALGLAGSLTALDKDYDGTVAATVDTSGLRLSGVIAGDQVELDLAGLTGRFADRHANATAQTVTLSGAGTLTGAGKDDYSFSVGAPTTTAFIRPRALTISSPQIAPKIYDATTMAGAVTAGHLAGLIGGETLGVSAVAGPLSSKNVGSQTASVRYTLADSATGLASDYRLADGFVTFAVTPAALTVSGSLTATSRVYDATTLATISTTGLTLGGVLGADIVSLRTSGATGAFADKNVGTGKTVTLDASNILTGPDAGNYVLAAGAPTALADITPALLGATGSFTAASRVYDATSLASITTAGLGLNGVLGSDVVTVKTSGATGQFVDKNVGTGKTVTLSAAGVLTGADAGNYAFASTAPTALADITPATLAVSGSFTAASRAYDATRVAGVSTNALAISGVLGGDNVSLKTSGATGTLADKNVGTSKTVFLTATGILTGADSGNYVLAAAAPTAQADITQAPLAVTGATAIDKRYDATVVASLSGGSIAAFAGDAVILSTATVTGSFDSKNVGTGKTVQAFGYALTGADAGNYALVQPTGLTASISPATLVVSDMTIADKVYDAGVAATLASGSVRPLGQDDVRVNLATADARFADKNAGTGKAVRISGLTLVGADAGNYTVVAPAGLTGNVTPARLLVSGAQVQDRAYDTTTLVALSGGTVTPLGADVVTLNMGQAVGAVASKTVGSGKSVTVSGYTLSGPDAANYAIVQPQGLSVDITPAKLTIAGVTALSRAYDGSTVVPLSGGVVTALGPDVVFLVASGAVARFADKNVGTDKAVTVTGYTLAGPDAANYSLVQPTGLMTSVTRLASVDWTGKGDGKNWFDPANWAGGAIPDEANVADVILTPSVNVTFDGTRAVSIDRLITTPDADTVPGSTDTALTLLKGNLIVAKDLTVDTLIQRGGALTGTGTVKVLDGFTQSGGAIAMTGDVSIHQGAGDLDTLSVSGRDILLVGEQAVRIADTTASRDLTIVAGRDATLGGPTLVGRNLSVTAGRSGAGAITQDRLIAVSGDTVLNAVGDIAPNRTDNRFGGTVTCTSTSGTVSGSCSAGGAIDRTRRVADDVSARLAAISSASGGAIGTATGLSSFGATSLLSGGPAAINAVPATAPDFATTPLVRSGSSAAAGLVAGAPAEVQVEDGAGGMLAKAISVAREGDEIYVTARFGGDDAKADYRQVLPQTNLGSSVYYVGN